MHYTEEQFLAANEIPIVDILRGNGEQIWKVRPSDEASM